MATQMRFFKKSWADFEKGVVAITATEGQDLVGYLIDRSNRTCWGTSGSLDANNTQVTIDMADIGSIDTILLLKHNFKNFLIEYWDDVGAVWVSLENVTNNAAASSYFSFAMITTSKFRLTIYGTVIANSDKYLFQFIATSQIGQLTGWPTFKSPIMSRNRMAKKMLSGKSHVLQNVGFYQTSLAHNYWNIDSDLTIVESLYEASDGFLFWPCGGNEGQFSMLRNGYRFEDIFLCRCKNEYSPEWVKGLYAAGLKLQIDLIEVVT
jgi:hypothetical protein